MSDDRARLTIVHSGLVGTETGDTISLDSIPISDHETAELTAFVRCLRKSWPVAGPNAYAVVHWSVRIKDRWFYGPTLAAALAKAEEANGMV